MRDYNTYGPTRTISAPIRAQTYVLKPRSSTLRPQVLIGLCPLRPGDLELDNWKLSTSPHRELCHLLSFLVLDLRNLEATKDKIESVGEGAPIFAYGPSLPSWLGKVSNVLVFFQH